VFTVVSVMHGHMNIKFKRNLVLVISLYVKRCSNDGSFGLKFGTRCFPLHLGGICLHLEGDLIRFRRQLNMNAAVSTETSEQT